MSLRSFAVALSVVLPLVAHPASPPAFTVRTAASRTEHTVPGEVLVKFKPSVTARARAAAVASLGHSVAAELAVGSARWARVQAAPGQSVAEAVAAYAARADVELAQPNFVYRASAAPNDPAYPALWGFRNSGQTIGTGFTQPQGTPIAYTTNNPGIAGLDMGLEKAWNAITDCRSVVVAVVDTGVNYTHVDLAANMWDGGASFPNHGRNFVQPADPAVGDANTMDLVGHGTHVAGTIGAVGNNATGVAGVCWSATIMAIRVLDETGSGTTADIISGLQWAVDHGAKVINMSLGGGGVFDAAFSNAITVAQAADVAVVVAAGNDASNNDAAPTPVYPCNFTQPNLICVAALDQAYQLASFSNYGATSVDVGAPGTNIVSTWPGTVLGDPLDGTRIPGWSRSSTTGGGWAFSSGLNIHALVDPAGLPAGSYNDNTDDRTWTEFNLSGATAAFLDFLFAVDIPSGDVLSVAARSGTGDPFATPAGVIGTLTAFSNFPNLDQVTLDVSACTVSTCTIGFRVQSDGVAAPFQRAAIAFLTVRRIENGATSLNVENGTSMATPATAGVVAMLRAYNPQFTYADAIAAVKGGGRSVGALTGFTTTGKAVDAIGALAFIKPPVGLNAVVH